MRTALSGLVVAFALLAAAAPVAAQETDTVRTGPYIRIDALPEGHSPEGALWRAAALPGWGQVYNGQYWKVPLVYAGLGALGYSVVYNWQHYWLYKRAHRWKISEERVERGELEDNPFPEDKDEYQQLEARFGPISSTNLRQQRIQFRRNLELSIIGTVLFYGLTLVDAYLSAHLLGFEVTDQLSISAQPTPGGIRTGLRVRF